MAGLVGFIGALADDLSTISAKVSASALDDITSQTTKSLSQTAGILVDDAAAIPQYVSNITPERELSVIWQIVKKSLRNKALMIPLAILITYLAPWVMTPILILGGSYLAFEGVESLGEKLGLIAVHHPTNSQKQKSSVTDEKTIASAVRTDTILSIEIIALTMASVAHEPIEIQLGVLVLIGLIATVVVYGVVGLIIKMDDVGLHLKTKHPNSQIHNKIANSLIHNMPRVLKTLSWIGAIAMLMVGGSILMHNIAVLDVLSYVNLSLNSILVVILKYAVLPIIWAAILGSSIVMVNQYVVQKK